MPISNIDMSLGSDGQAWQNLTGSRAIGTTYTNSTGKPIQVHITANIGTSGNINININGVGAAQFVGGAGAGVTFLGVCYSVIPDGATYVVTNGTLNSWYELR